ncbi:Remorin [Capsicum chinense]|nr:Remorin [Capsicum chinense]
MEGASTPLMEETTITKAGVPPPVNQEPPLASVATPNDAVAPPPHGTTTTPQAPTLFTPQEADISSKKVAKGSLHREKLKSEYLDGGSVHWAQKKLSEVATWEKTQRTKLEAKLKKVEDQLEHKIDEYAEKIKNEVALICKEADENIVYFIQLPKCFLISEFHMRKKLSLSKSDLPINNGITKYDSLETRAPPLSLALSLCADAEQHTESNSIGPRLLAILDQLDTTGENLEDMHQEALIRTSVKMEEMSKEEKLETTTTLPILQEEVHQEEKPSYDDELGSEDSSVTSQSTESYEKEEA